MKPLSKIVRPFAGSIDGRSVMYQAGENRLLSFYATADRLTWGQAFERVRQYLLDPTKSLDASFMPYRLTETAILDAN